MKTSMLSNNAVFRIDFIHGQLYIFYDVISGSQAAESVGCFGCVIFVFHFSNLLL